ncbi:MAG TPA: hypothetical protein VHC49_21420 [Mycobacteriales bacterium]|nr:hypothetical protein [Mycobacteriales bacterium]
MFRARILGCLLAAACAVLLLPAAATGRTPTAEELILKHADVAAGPLEFGAQPLAFVQSAAAAAASAADCTISPEEATALTIAMTWPETSPGGESPSPMTLSRYDTQSSLADPENRAPGLWFHPGIGIWQLDSAGLGTDFTAAEAMDTQYAASKMAPYIVGKYCTSVNGGADAATARAAAWSDWVACRAGACEDTYNRALQGITPVDEVTRYGGAEPRQCLVGGIAYECLFVDPAAAQGANWWAAPGGGNSPVAAPFYVYRDTAGGTEVRYWLAADSGAATDVVATRPFGTNARGGLSWAEGTGLCDTTANRGTCTSQAG